MTDHISLKYFFSQTDLNARKARWLSFLSEFDMDIKHIRGKENKIVDALSRNACQNINSIGSSANFDLEDLVKKVADQDPNYENLQVKILKKEMAEYTQNQKGLICYKNRLYIPNVETLKKEILDEYYKQPYVGHPGYQKMLTALRKNFFWPRMKRYVAEYLARCMECQLVKVEHQHPAGLLNPFPISEWKWDIVSIYFITWLPKTKYQHDSVMVVVDTLTKDAHFIPVKSTFGIAQVTNLFLKEVVRIHRVPKMIVLDRDAKFTTDFWKGIFGGMGTKLNFSTAYHPQADGQTEITNQILEDMLRMYVMDRPSKWEDYLHLAEFAYNNNYQSSIRMSLFEALYGRKCRTPLSWIQPEDKLMLGPDALQEMEIIVKQIQRNIETTQYR